MSLPSDSTLPIVSLPVSAIDGGKAIKARSINSPDLRHWQIEEFLRQTGKADNTQRVYRGQL